MTRARKVTRALLRRMPLPRLDDDGDKDVRGRVLAIGGSTEVPGAILLAGVAALRAGAGKLQLATVRSASAALGVAVPEALVVALPETRSGEIAGAAASHLLSRRWNSVDAILLGPGMSSARSAHALLHAVVHEIGDDTTLVIDAGALLALQGNRGLVRRLGGRVILTPHAGEMASMLGADRIDVERNAAAYARDAAERFGAVVALKGAETWIAEPAGALFHYEGGSVGLATSGSGDTLAGVVAGLAARGAPASCAAVWGAYLHGAAGAVLTRRMGRVGFLARELLAELPALLRRAT
jgi:hydroxyethylthiazole kinase-like uncharacterized protein yjeF